MPIISYDPEVKILNIKLNKNKIVDSDAQGRCILDYDGDGNIVNIEVLDVNLNKVLKKRTTTSRKSS